MQFRHDTSAVAAKARDLERLFYCQQHRQRRSDGSHPQTSRTCGSNACIMLIGLARSISYVAQTKQTYLTAEGGRISTV